MQQQALDFVLMVQIGRLFQVEKSTEVTLKLEYVFCQVVER